MSTGDQSDCFNRLKTALPNGWFNEPTPVLDALLQGFAWALSLGYSLISYTRLQTRIATATDVFLDLISGDFFGSALPRNQQEQDGPFRTRILANLLRERATRRGLIEALVLLTGRTPIVFEPARPLDTGAYNENICGYSVAGGYGSLTLPSQAFVIAYRPSGSGIPYIAGYGSPEGAYNTPSQTEYASLDQVIGNVTDADIYSTIDQVKPVASIIWTQLSF
jgi:hypothetical protein